MKNFVSIIVILLLHVHVVWATNPDVNSNRANARVYAYIDGVFSELSYQKGQKKIAQETFRKAYYGYLNLLEHGKITNRRYLTICDFSLSSNENRMWVIDVPNKKVIINTLVAHGAATGEEFARNFSNVPESHQSSLGFYVTKQTYHGGHGYSLRLAGVDGHFNSNAESRDVVVHGADYVSKEFAQAHKRIGRSWGCPAVHPKVAAPLIDKIRNGSCFFIYHPSPAYLRTSFWLNDRITQIPRDMDKIEDVGEVETIESTVTEPTIVEKDVTKTESTDVPSEKDTFLMTVTEYQEPEEIVQLQNDKSITIRSYLIPEDELTPEIRAKALKKKKVVRNISKIIYVGGKNDAASLN